MSQSLAALPRLRSRSRRVVLAVVAAAGVGGLVVALMGPTRGAPSSLPPGPGSELEWACVLESATEPAPPPEVELPDDADQRLARCLRLWRGDDRPGTAGRFLRDRDVTVADVHHWIDVEHDPAWVEDGLWWVPLSGEGIEEMPSGLYGGVALAGPVESVGCRQAIMN